MQESKVHCFFVLQADQIVAKLMMNMAAVDRRLAEEASRQNLVSYKLKWSLQVNGEENIELFL